MTPHQFIARWQAADLSERAACQSHFADLCSVLGQPKPSDVDPIGAWYAFEKGVDTSEGRKGWADVWLKGKFGWEYKRKHRDLKAAYKQLQLYREALENPPLLIVCDLNRFEVHTNFTGYATKTYEFDLEGLKDPRNVQILRHAFTEPEKLRPDRMEEAVAARLQKVSPRCPTRLSDVPRKA